MKRVYKQFFQYVFLHMLGSLGTSFYILADTFFTARRLGSNGLAALNLCISIFSLMHGVGLMLGIGGATRFTLSEKQKEKGDVIFSKTLVMGMGAGLLFAGAGLLANRPMALFLGADQETLEMTHIYLATILSFSPCFIGNNILLAFVRNDGNPKLAMVAVLTSSLINVLLDYVFLFICNMGIFGAAFASGISPLLSMGVLLLHVKGKKVGFSWISPLRWKERNCRIGVGQILGPGLSSLVGEMATAVALYTFNWTMWKIGGNTGVAAYGIVANLALVATALFVGISQGMQPLVSGACVREENRTMGVLQKLGFGSALALAGLLYLVAAGGAVPITAVFNGENDVALAQLAVLGLRLYFLGYFAAGVNIVGTAFLSALDAPGPALVISLFRSCLLMVPILLGLVAWLGTTGAWLSFLCTETPVAIYMFYKLHQRDSFQKKAVSA